jgi:membrane-associated phospholipid phosphatase
MKHFSISKQLQYYLVAQLVAIILYYGSIYLTSMKPAELHMTYLDGLIKFHWLSGYIYVSFFLLLMVTILFSDEIIARQCAYVFILDSIVASVCFYLFPTKMPDHYLNDPNMSGQIMKLIRLIDGNYNCFPSLHIANSLGLTYLFNLKRSLPVKIIFWTWFALITYSVLSIKQHYFIDVVGGISLAVINITIVRYFRWLEIKII